MSIFDDTGESSSITELSRSIRLFTDRYHLIRVFTRALHEDDALGKILFLRGGGGNGKSLLIRFLQHHACKRFFDWNELDQQSDAELVRRLQQSDPSFHTTFHPLPVAHIDFHAPPREFEQPTVDYDALLMLRRQLGRFHAESFARLRFPVYDFAAVWYLHKTGRLTDERLSTLFPREEINLVIALAEIVKDRPIARVAQAVLELFDDRLGGWWTLFRHRRRVDHAVIEDIKAMDPERDLIPEMPRLFAMDLNAALTTPGAPPRIVLLADGHEVFSGLNGGSGMEGDRDLWLRNLLGRLHLQEGIVPVITSRQELDWADRPRCAIPLQYLDPRPVGHFSDADATAYLAKAGVDDADLRARLCDYARVAPDEIHPLYAGLGADVVLQAIQQGRRLRVEDFPDRLPGAQTKPRLLVERLLREATTDVEYAVRSLAAARSFDRGLFEELGSRERSRYPATDAAFDTLTRFSFVWETQSRGGGWYSIHTLLQRIFREREDERVREADAVLEAIYRERFEDGDALALAEVAYYAYQLEPERGLNVWANAFEVATTHSQYALCEALRTVGAEFNIEEPTRRARISGEEGEYLLARSRYAEAAEVLRASVSASDEAIRRAPNDAYPYSNKGEALRSLGSVLATVSSYEAAEGAYTDALAAFDEALGRAPDDPRVYNLKGDALFAKGNLLAILSRYGEAERSYVGAVAAAEGALGRASDYIGAYDTKGKTQQMYGDLLVSMARYQEAEGAFRASVTAFDEALGRAPDHIQVHNNKGIALHRHGNLLALLFRDDEAEEVYTDAVAAFDEALSRARDYAGAYGNKGDVLRSLGDLLARSPRYQEAEGAFRASVTAFDEALGRAPDDNRNYNNKGVALRSLGDLLADLSREKEAEGVFTNAVATFDEALSRARDDIYAYNNKGAALLSFGDLLAGLSREEAEDTYTDAMAAFEEALSRAPDYVEAYNNKGVALRSYGDLLASLSREEEAKGIYTDAVDAFDGALSRASDYTHAYVHKGITILALGNLLAGLSRYREAGEAFRDAAAALDEVLRRMPDDADVHHLKALSLMSQAEMVGLIGGREQVVHTLWTEAQSHAERVLTLEPGNEEAASLLAEIRRLLDTLDEPSQG